MPRPTARVLRLLDLLQSSGTRTVGELAAALDVDERTVRRYVDHLRDLGVPVESRRGRHGGYRVAPGFRMPPLLLADDEALAVLTGLAALRADASAPVAPAAVETAIAKIRRAIPAALAERSAGLLEASTTGRLDTTPATATAPDPGILLTVADAVRHRRPLALRYLGRAEADAGNSPADRTLQPHDLVAHAGRWYVRGWEPARQEVRTLRLDRIRAARALPGTLPAPPAHDAAAELLASFATADYRHTVRLRVRANRAELRRALPAAVAMIGDADAEGRHPVEIHAERLDWLPALLLGLPGEVAIDEAPDELRRVLAEAGARLSALSMG